MLEGRSSCLSLDVKVPSVTLTDVNVNHVVAELGCQLESIDVRHLGGQSKGSLHFGHEVLWAKTLKSW